MVLSSVMAELCLGTLSGLSGIVWPSMSHSCLGLGGLIMVPVTTVWHTKTTWMVIVFLLDLSTYYQQEPWPRFMWDSCWVHSGTQVFICVENRFVLAS